MSEKSSGRWLGVIVILAALVFVLPLVVVWGILTLSPELRVVATIAIIILWGVASGYKEWIISKRER